MLSNYATWVHMLKITPFLSHVYGARADVMTNIKSFSTEMFRKEALNYVLNQSFI